MFGFTQLWLLGFRMFVWSLWVHIVVVLKFYNHISRPFVGNIYVQRVVLLSLTIMYHRPIVFTLVVCRVLYPFLLPSIPTFSPHPCLLYCILHCRTHILTVIPNVIHLI